MLNSSPVLSQLLLSKKSNKTILLLCYCLVFNVLAIRAQVVYITPTFATADDSVSLYFDASKGNAGLLGENKCIAHLGLITNLSKNGSDWKYVQGAWGQDFAKTRMTGLGNNRWFIRFHVRSFFGVPITETVQKIAVVFHNANGNSSKKGADMGGADLFIPLSSGAFEVKLQTPTKHSFVSRTDTIRVTGSAVSNAVLNLYINGTLVKNVIADSVLNYSFLMDTLNTQKAKIILEGINGTSTSFDTTYVILKGNLNVAQSPAGTVDGINYIDSQTVVLRFLAPNKQFAFAIGDFSNWELDPAYRMNKTPDGSRYWIRLNNLVPGKEYRYQFVVDEEKITIADVYADKQLDFWNDAYIPKETYPDLIPYPSGLTTDPVSVFQTAQIPYAWNDSAFVKPPADRLFIYEMLLRDFIGKHDFQTLTDTIAYFKNMGVNVIELMPINEFDGNESWGYNPNFFFAVDKYYGTKNAFKHFVDVCHQNGIAVVLDIVLNHSWGLNPQVKLYFNKTTGKPENNVWFNPTATHPFSVGYDYNHESQFTQEFIDRVLAYWVNDYHIDGYRFDLSKGFTQKNTGENVSAWSAYDQSRVNLLNRMRLEFRKTCADCYMILEHLGDNQEETVLANNGFMLWGKMTDAYNEATMGYTGSKQDLSWGNYKTRSWNSPNLVTYAESHDEERLMFKNKTYGRITASYNAREIKVGLNRTAAAMAMLLPLRGPKMIWQFGEMGYDISIDQNGRTGNKPILWNYLDDPDRFKLYQTVQRLGYLKSIDAFNSNQYVYNTSGSSKILKISDSSFHTVIIANLDITTANIQPQFQQTGTWYDAFSSDSISINKTTDTIVLAPGNFKIYTSKALNLKAISTGVTPNRILKEEVFLYPNPTSDLVYLELNQFNHKPQFSFYDVTGKLYQLPVEVIQQANSTYLLEINTASLPTGVYFIKIDNSMNGSSVLRFLKK
jgi:hypothetical protein